VDSDKSHDVARIKAVLMARKSSLGKKEAAFLDALVPYWGTVSDLAQRQEHGSQRDEEQEPLIWEDARRLVFQALVVMHETERAVGTK
jgi:hypothetical protein